MSSKPLKDHPMFLRSCRRRIRQGYIKLGMKTMIRWDVVRPASPRCGKDCLSYVQYRSGGGGVIGPFVVSNVTKKLDCTLIPSLTAGRHKCIRIERYLGPQIFRKSSWFRNQNPTAWLSLKPKSIAYIETQQHCIHNANRISLRRTPPSVKWVIILAMLLGCSGS